MFRGLAIGLLCLPAFLAIPVSAQDAELTVDQIIAKHTEAVGGIDKLNAIQSVSMTGNAVLMGGQFEAPMTLKMKRPSSLRTDITVNGQSVTQAFDGTVAWSINPFMSGPDPQKASDEDAQQMREDSDFIEGSLVNYKAKGSTIELIGKEDVAGAQAYKLKVTKKSGSVDYEYLDAKTFLPVRGTGKRKQAGQEMDIETLPSNYKQVNGVMMPFALTQNMNGNALMDLKIEKIEVNVPIDDAIFHMPDKPKEEKKDTPKQ